MITGKQALRHFFEEAEYYDVPNLPLDFDDFLQYLKDSPERGHNFLEATLDNAIKVLQDDSFFGIDAQVRDSMQKLAVQTRGKLPHSGAFVMALSNQFTNVPEPLVTYFQIIEQVKDVTANVVSNVGESVVNLAENVNWVTKYSKWILMGAVGIGVLYSVRRIVPKS